MAKYTVERLIPDEKGNALLMIDGVEADDSAMTPTGGLLFLMRPSITTAGTPGKPDIVRAYAPGVWRHMEKLS